MKVGNGAFMKTLDEARALAEDDDRASARGAGSEVVAMLTDMDQPLGRAVGNALEIREALVDGLRRGAADFEELVSPSARCCSRSRTSASAGSRAGCARARRSATARRS